MALKSIGKRGFKSFSLINKDLLLLHPKIKDFCYYLYFTIANYNRTNYSIANLKTHSVSVGILYQGVSMSVTNFETFMEILLDIIQLLDVSKSVTNFESFTVILDIIPLQDVPKSVINLETLTEALLGIIPFYIHSINVLWVTFYSRGFQCQ